MLLVLSKQLTCLPTNEARQINPLPLMLLRLELLPSTTRTLQAVGTKLLISTQFTFSFIFTFTSQQVLHSHLRFTYCTMALLSSRLCFSRNSNGYPLRWLAAFAPFITVLKKVRNLLN